MPGGWFLISLWEHTCIWLNYQASENTGLAFCTLTCTGSCSFTSLCCCWLTRLHLTSDRSTKLLWAGSWALQLRLWGRRLPCSAPGAPARIPCAGRDRSWPHHWTGIGRAGYDDGWVLQLDVDSWSLEPTDMGLWESMKNEAGNWKGKLMYEDWALLGRVEKKRKQSGILADTHKNHVTAQEQSFQSWCRVSRSP